MRILFVSAEVAPLAKVGGMGDVVGALPKVLRAMGHDVRIFMPFYGFIADKLVDAPKEPIWWSGLPSMKQPCREPMFPYT